MSYKAQTEKDRHYVNWIVSQFIETSIRISITSVRIISSSHSTHCTPFSKGVWFIPQKDLRQTQSLPPPRPKQADLKS